MKQSVHFSNPVYSKAFKGYLPLGYDYKPGEKGTMGFSKKCTKGYRFGFNGYEKDDETYGAGNEYDYGFRIYNPRLGRFLSVDPLTADFAMLTPYQFASNTPIWATDLDGLEAKIYQSSLKDNMGFKAMMAIADQTTLGKEFNKVLKSQNKIDVFYLPMSNEMRLPGSGIKTNAIDIDAEGYADGYAGATAPTIVWSAEDLLKQSTTFDWIDPKELESSFKAGKGVLLIAISKGTIDAPKTADFTMEKLANFRASGAETIVHEEWSHGLNLLKGNNIGEYQEHQNYHGDYGKGSPKTKDLLTGSKYSLTNAGKAIKEIKSITTKSYDVDKKKE